MCMCIYTMYTPIYTYIVYMSIPTYQFIMLPHPLLVSASLFSTSVSLFLFWKFIYTHYSRFHKSDIIRYLFFSFRLTSLWWQSLGPSTCLQMSLFCSFLWVNNINNQQGINLWNIQPLGFLTESSLIFTHCPSQIITMQITFKTSISG